MKREKPVITRKLLIIAFCVSFVAAIGIKEIAYLLGGFYKDTIFDTVNVMALGLFVYFWKALRCIDRLEKGIKPEELVGNHTSRFLHRKEDPAILNLVMNVKFMFLMFLLCFAAAKAITKAAYFLGGHYEITIFLTATTLALFAFFCYRKSLQRVRELAREKWVGYSEK